MVLKEVECLIQGRVQGVMYRDFVQRQARMRGLVGRVQNLVDGGVRVIAQGDESDLKSLIMKLRRGSFFSRVDSISVTWRDPVSEFKAFNIIYE